MPENSNLLKQLANRCKLFHSQTGISQTQVAKAVGMSDDNYSAFLSGRKGIGSEATCLLLKYTALSPQQAVAAFSKPVFSASVLHLKSEEGSRTLIIMAGNRDLVATRTTPLTLPILLMSGAKQLKTCWRYWRHWMN
jgi:hypothetical protein